MERISHYLLAKTTMLVGYIYNTNPYPLPSNLRHRKERQCQDEGRWWISLRKRSAGTYPTFAAVKNAARIKSTYWSTCVLNANKIIKMLFFPDLLCYIHSTSRTKRWLVSVLLSKRILLTRIRETMSLLEMHIFAIGIYYSSRAFICFGLHDSIHTNRCCTIAIQI